jgi:methyl coenzyme M reductase subunit D
MNTRNPLDRKEQISLMLTPGMREKLNQMHKNSIKIYGKEISMSRIVETLILNASDRKTQIKERIKKIQRELCVLGDELSLIKQEEEAHP